MLWHRFSVLGVVCALVSGVVVAQDFAIDGKDFESGAADAKLAEIARQAAASGKSVVVSTPPYWQAKAAGKLRAAAPGVQVKTSDAFFENVLVRIVDVDKSSKTEAAAAKPVETGAKAVEPAPSPKPAPHVEAKAVAAAPAEPVNKEPETAAKAAASAQLAIAKPAPTPASHEVQTPKPAAEPRAVQAPVAPAAAPAIAVASISPPPSAVAETKQASADTAAIKRSFENQFNLGRPADGALRANQLQKGDEIFVNGPVFAAVRKERSRVQLFWIDGGLNLERAELVKTDANRYRVDEPIRDVANPSLRAMHSEPKILAVQVPTAQVRADMERHFNDAKVISVRMSPGELRYGDLFYVYRQYAVVFRRNDLGFDRYWLEGEIDLNQSGVIKDGDAYRIVSERL